MSVGPFLLLWGATLWAVSPPVARDSPAPVRFVDDDAGGANDGTSWEDAFTDLQEALTRAEPGSQVWVAAGVYRAGADRTATFELRDGVGVFGGFAGTEDPESFRLSDRDTAANETVLQGGLIGGEASYHVVTAAGVNSTATLDGFTVTGGRADGASAFRQDVGGGLLIGDASPRIVNCTFTANEAAWGGGAYIAGGAPTLLHCRFVGNRSIACQPSNPLANRGGAVYSTAGVDSAARPAFYGCLFVGNSAGVGCGGRGGAIFNEGAGHVRLSGCTVTGNSADDDGGGIALISGSVSLSNSVVWGNRDSGGANRSAQIFGAVAAEYTCVQGGYPGTGNITEDPRFTDDKGPDGILGTADDDLRLAPGSPCIDAGNNARVPTDETDLDTDGNTGESLPLDLAGAARFVDDPVRADTGTGSPPIVDLGAFEYQAECLLPADCDDQLSCNGIEDCVAGTCVPGVPVSCDDGVECTDDVCDEGTDACVFTPNDALCDNGAFCDGAEVCNLSAGCVDGPAPDCDDGNPDTIDSCDEDTDMCVNTVECMLYDMNGDGFLSIVGDVGTFVRVVYAGDYEWYEQQFPGRDPICRGDCNCDGVLSIAGDTACFTNCVYFGECPECADWFDAP